jgi:hypothetical protein
MTSTDYTAALLVADVSDALGVVAALQTAAHRSLAPFTPLKDPYYKLNHDLLLRAADIIRALTAQTSTPKPLEAHVWTLEEILRREA